jgi:GNAT superfamily N-acetyltransferase
MEIIKLEKKYINQVIELALKNYEEEKEILSYLPEKEDFRKNIEKYINRIFEIGEGFLALKGEFLIGYLIGFEIPELFGKCKGVYSPLFANGIVKENRKKILQHLYSKCSELWVEKNYTSHAITIYAQDVISFETYSWLGFGMRCVDSIKEIKPTDEKTLIEIKKAEIKDAHLLEEISIEFANYMKSSPLFMLHDPNDDHTKEHQEFLENQNNHLWIAYNDNKAIGYIKIQPEGETFISLHEKVMNITGAFVLPEYRNSNVASSLLNIVEKWSLDNNYKLLGVDFESFNILGSSFWNKYFTPYTYSLVRRIDERIGGDIN